MRKVALILSCLLIIGSSGCTTKKQFDLKPDITQIQSICDLATLECYYHNVAKSEKTAGGMFEVDRKFWIEYTGIAKIGIDMTKVDMKIDGENIIVYLPPAKLLGIDIEELNEDSYILSGDSLFKNKITMDEQTKAISSAQEQMAKNVMGNDALLQSAQRRAQDLIENYINQMGEISDSEYKIEWVYETEEPTE